MAEITARDRALALRKERVGKLSVMLSKSDIISKFSDRVGEEAKAYTASLLEAYSGDSRLQECNPADVVGECLKAATMRLPVNKQLGLAYIIPYKNVPQLQISYKGIIQLAMRSGQYKAINADCVYEGETVKHDRLSGMIEVSGTPISDTAIGYFAYCKLINGYEQCVYWTRDRVDAHRKRFSRTSSFDSPWNSNFDAMAKKTLLKQVLKFMPISLDVANVLNAEPDEQEEATVVSGEQLDFVADTEFTDTVQAVPSSDSQDTVTVQTEDEPDF